jgi:HSP20 family protein
LLEQSFEHHNYKPDGKGLRMAEKSNALTPTREENRRELRRPWGSEWSPFRALHRMADEMDRMIEDAGFSRRGARSFWREGESSDIWAPQVEVFQRNNELTVRADLPGLKRDDIKVDITDNEICIQGERKHEHAEERDGYYRSERGYGSFSRTIPLPEGAMTDQAKAKFKDGVLEVTMPAPPASKGRRLEISEATGSGTERGSNL